jgi:hypothetical protein
MSKSKSESKSEFVCELDGLPVHFWAGKSWKHMANQHQRSCGRPPKVVSRTAYDAMVAGVTAAFRHALGNRVDARPKER